MEELVMSEMQKYYTIKDLVEGKINRQRAELILGLKKRRVNQLIHIYKTIGKSGFIHGNVGKIPSNKIDSATDKKLMELRKKEFFDFNYLHAIEIIKDEYNLNVSYTHVYNLWMSNLDPSKDAHLITKKEVKKKLKELIKTEPETNVHDRKEIIKRIDTEFAHARIPSCKYFGEVVEIDACNERWFDGVKYHLYSAVDNATGTLLATHMEKEETLRGYLILLHKVLVKYGIPANIYADRRNVFDLKRKKDPLIEKDLHTQFGYICKQLGIFLECSSEPTFKPKVERSFRTTQSRLIPELRRANIHSLDEANLYIEHNCQVKFNTNFSSYSNNTKSVFIGVDNIEDLSHILSIKTLKK